MAVLVKLAKDITHMLVELTTEVKLVLVVLVVLVVEVKCVLDILYLQKEQ